MTYMGKHTCLILTDAAVMKSIWPLLSSSFSKDKQFIVKSPGASIADNLSRVAKATSIHSAETSAVSGFFALVSVSMCCRVNNLTITTIEY